MSDPCRDHSHWRTRKTTNQLKPPAHEAAITTRLTRSTSKTISLTELQRIKKWHVAHRAERAVEYQLWEAVLTLWVLGWVGWLPAFAFDAWWALPLCVIAMAAPALYICWRRLAHLTNLLRCEWLDPTAPR